MIHKIPALLRFLFFVSIGYIVLFSGLRLAFWLYFSDAADNIPADVMLESFYIGYKFDLRLTMFVIAPALFLGWIKTLSPTWNETARKGWAIYFGIASLALLVHYSLDWAHFAYLRTRMDATILRFLADFETSMQMAWETYPVISGTLALLVIAGAAGWLIYRLSCYTAQHPGMELPTKKKKAVVATVASFVFLAGCYGNLSWYPLRWSNAFFSTHPFASSIALNPVIYYGETFKNQKISYTEESVQQHYDVMADYLQLPSPDKPGLDYRRLVTPVNPVVAINGRKPNVVLVFLESFAAYKTGVFGNTLNPTPNFDRLAADGLMFKNHYVPHNGTARNVFALLTGLPDIETEATSSRNPTIVNQNLILDQYDGYKKFYFLGGSTNWGNIRGVISSNIEDLTIFEEGSYRAPRVDAWGISDIHLFEEAADVLDKQDKPFVAVLQTSGNHRPYNITDDNKGFKYDAQESKVLKANGFVSNKEYNSFRFMDHSIGYFIEHARKKKFFKNTIFVFYADHGLLVGNPGAHMPKTEQPLHITRHHIPLLVYAPHLITEPKTITRVTSSLDVMTSIASLAGITHLNTTLGRNFFDDKYDGERYAFALWHSTPLRIGVIGDRYYFRMFADGSEKSLFDLQSEEPFADFKDQFPDKARRMEEITWAIYESTKYMLRNNGAKYKDKNNKVVR
ncbi:MAG: sulfatase-like hydrolase/transferase [Gammaproteobacteria bacterium]|nr:sulfatase-like hydrolase/transferase [Gammaproteobacteria bacterium]